MPHHDLPDCAPKCVDVEQYLEQSITEREEAEETLASLVERLEKVTERIERVIQQSETPFGDLERSYDPRQPL